MAEITVFENTDDLQKSVAQKIIELASKYIHESGRFTIALSGGSTPSGLYVLLATDNYANLIDWKKVFIFWGDERMADMNADENNGYTAQKIFLDKINIPSQNIYRINTTLLPANAAKDYNNKIKQFFNSDLPSFDLILLGMGTNGHTASLFPHTDILHETSVLVKEVYLKEQRNFRISFTIPLINNAAHIFFLVNGNEKAAMLYTVMKGQYLPESYPAQYINPKSNNLYWFVDKAAASLIKN
ncbi:MAG: 6-phosphogluconolactonase [Ferruginibacter sp.]